MVKVETPNHWYSVEWDKDGRPVLWVIGEGKYSPKEAIAVIRVAVDMVTSGPFDHVCSVYNVLRCQIPFLGRFLGQGSVPTSSRTAHIIVGTHSNAIRLLASMIAVTANKRLRTMEVCITDEEVENSVNKWLAMPDRARTYTINDV